MTLSLEAESLAKEALKAAEDARKAQQRLQMLKKRYGMMKKEAKTSKAVTPTTPTITKPVMEEATKTVIAPSTPTKTVVEVHKDHQQHEESSTDYTFPTIETRGTGSVTTNEKQIEDVLASLGPPPPPPPPPKVIRAVSPRNEEPPVAEPEVVETRDEGVSKMAETKTEVAVPPQRESAEVQEEEVVKAVEEQNVEQKFANAEKLLAEVKQDIAPEPAQTTATPEWSKPQVVQETRGEAPREEHVAQEQTTPVVVEAPKEVQDKPVESEPTREPIPQPSKPVVQQVQQPVESKPEQKIFSFYEATTSLPVVQEGREDSQVVEQLPVPPTPVEPATVQPTPMFEPATVQPTPVIEPATVQPTPVVEPATVQPTPVVEPATVQPTPMIEPAAVQPTPMIEPAAVQPTPVERPKEAPPSSETQMPSVEQRKEEPQEGRYPIMMEEPNQHHAAQPIGHRRGGSSGNRAESYRLPKPAYMEAEAMLGSMLHNDPRQQFSPRQQRQNVARHHQYHYQQPVGKAMPEMAVPAPPASHYYSVPGTLHPIDELQQRVAAIPETKDDIPAPHYQHDPYGGAYHYGDDVSVLTDFHYSKPTSPRHINREPIAEESPALREPPESPRHPVNEEGSMYGDAPERDTRLQSNQSQQGGGHQRNFSQADTPRFRNSDLPISPRSDPAGQLEPDQNDPRQPQIQDPPQINSHKFDHEAGRGMEPDQVKMSPLVSHLRNRVEPEGKGRQHPPRPNRRVQLSIDPNLPRHPEAPETVSPLSLAGHSTAHQFQQNRAAPLGYNTPYGGYASGAPIVSNAPQVQHRYITTRSGAATVASYHRAHYPGDATVMSHQPMMRSGSPMFRSSPVQFPSGGSVSSMPYQRTEFFHPSGGGAFHEQHYVPSGAASVAASAGGETIISVRTNARGNKVVKKLVKVEEENETDPVVAFCDLINIDKVCGIEFDEQYKVVEEELPPEPLTAADVGRNAAMGKKVFNENNYSDPFAGRHNDAGLCGLL